MSYLPTELPLDTLSDSSGDSEVTQIHSAGPNDHWKYTHWKVIRILGGWSTVECDCSLEPEAIVYHKSYREMKQELKIFDA